MSPRHFSPRFCFSFWAGSLNSQQIQSSISPRWVFKHHTTAVPVNFLDCAHNTTRHMGRPVSPKPGSMISIKHSCHDAKRHQKSWKLKTLAASSSYRASPPPAESWLDAFTGLHQHRSRPPCHKMKTNLSSKDCRLPHGWVATRRLQNV